MSTVEEEIVESPPKKIRIDEIIVEDRQRQDIPSEHIDWLADSIKNNGLFHPITITREKKLVMGMCRILAHVRLGEEEIEYRYTDEDVSQLDLEVMELEENIRRKELEFWEEAAAISRIHERMKEKDPKWNMRKTADMIGSSVGHVSKYGKLAKEIKKDPKLKKEKGVDSALNKLRKKEKLENKRKVIEQRNKGYVQAIPAKIHVGDAYELIQQEPDESFDAVVSNFPFGIDLQFKNGIQPYDDDEDMIVDLARNVVYECYRVLAPDSWMVVFFSTEKLMYNSYMHEIYKRLAPMLKKQKREGVSDTMDILNKAMGMRWWLKQAGFNYVSPIPAQWVKPNKLSGSVGDGKALITAYESFLFAAKGNPPLYKEGKQNIFIHDSPLPSTKIHDVQMPISLCREIISMVCLGKSKILDPFAGSGSVGIGALDHQCSFTGYELNPEYAKRGNTRLKNHERTAGGDGE